MSVAPTVAAIVAALLAAAGLAARRRLGTGRAALALVAAALLGIYAAGVLSSLPDLQQGLEDAADTLGAWTYAVAAVGALLETGTLLGVPLPFEFSLILGGAVAADGAIELLPLMVLAWLGGFTGEALHYLFGDRVGRAFAIRHGARVGVTRERLERAHLWFERHGGKAVALAPFIPLMRSSVPFLAGASRMRYRHFLACALAGTAAWAVAFCALGYAFYRSIETVADVVTGVGLALLAAGIVGFFLVRRVRARSASGASPRPRGAG